MRIMRQSCSNMFLASLLATANRSVTAFSPLKTGVTNQVSRVSSFTSSSFRAETGRPSSAALFSSTTDTTSAISQTKLSPKVMQTLDPCVVVMKEMIGQYAHLWEDKGGIFSLAQGVVYWEPPSTCQEALQEELSKSSNLLHTYGPAHGIPELVDALQNKIATENGMTNHHVMVTVGANQAYTNCVVTCLSADTKSVVFAPYYFNHVMAIQMTNGDDSVMVGPCTDEGIPNLVWLQETLEKSAPGEISMVTIVNPGNPTGVSLSKETLQRAVDLCREHDAWLVLDCTYEYFTTEREDHQPIATFPDDPHVLHIFSFSKSYSLAGYRCGYVCLNKDSEGLWSNMMKVQDTIPIGPPRISQIAALGALKAGKGWVYDKYDSLEGSRHAILGSLEPLRTMGGTGAMYVMAQLPETTQDDIEVCRRLVEEYGIAIIPGSYCGFPGWIRVCYANLEPEVCLTAAERLREGIQNIVLKE